MRATALLQTGVRLIYPPTCLTCDAMVDMDHGLCGPCWRETAFVGGAVCNACGSPLIGDGVQGTDLCDDCLRHDRPWNAGRTTLIYAGNGRKIVLGLKHGDRLEYAVPAAQWMVQAGRDLVQPEMVVAAVPLHWRRRLKRKYNQSVELGRGVSRGFGLAFCPDLLIRPQATPVLDGKSAGERFQALTGALAIHPKRQGLIKGRAVLVVDDVMTSGATLSAATQVLRQGGAAGIYVLTLARAVKEA